ncbi:MAG TPA: hypothetical protein VHM91_21690, partial [Verrucomicrobiales bacterium]|nr:hypothetical protein [Verrucomicrobiales bacterium]
VYCLSWAADFRGSEQGGSAFQFLTFAVTAASGFTLVILGWKFLFRKPLGWLVLLWSVFLATTAVVAVVQHVIPGNYLRTILPWMLVLSSMVVCQVAAGFGLSLRQVLLPMLIACAINVVWRAFYALAISGIDPERVRVEMLSQCLPLLMALLMCSLFLQRTWPVWPVILGGLGIASYVYSITRSAIFIIGAALIGALLAARASRRIGNLPPGFAKTKLRHLGGCLAALVVILGLFAAANPHVVARWDERLFHAVGSESSSMDPSTLTRLAETEAFIKILDGDPLNYSIGMGIGQKYYWDEAYAPELCAYTYGDVDIFRSDFREIWFPGHAIWTYAIFSGGFFGLICHAVFFCVAIGMAWRAGKHATQSGAVPLHLAWLPFCGMLAFVSASLTFNPFIERAAGLVLGFIVGLPQFIMRDSTKYAAVRKRLARALAVPFPQGREEVPA